MLRTGVIGATCDGLTLWGVAGDSCADVMRERCQVPAALMMQGSSIVLCGCGQTQLDLSLSMNYSAPFYAASINSIAAFVSVSLPIFSR